VWLTIPHAWDCFVYRDRLYVLVGEDFRWVPTT